MSNTELKPCPFCGCCDVQDDLSLNAFICDDCGAVGPESPVDGDYAAAWNTRPAPVVKDLVWVDVLLGGSLMADTVFGEVQIYFDGTAGWLVNRDGHDDSWVEYPSDGGCDWGFETREDAVRFVEEYTTTRILSALA